MREKHQWHSRTTEERQIKAKYFLVYEGEKTEEIYFDGVIKNSKRLGINPLVEVIPLVKDYSEKGYSNPQKLLSRVIGILEENKTKCYSYRTLIDTLISCIKENQCDVSISEIGKMLKDICQENIETNLELDIREIEKDCKILLDNLYKRIFIQRLPDVHTIIRNMRFLYSEDFDKICLIVDRDKNSFTGSQYMNVLKVCKDKKFDLYVTNPCFELWLVLHMCKVCDLTDEDLVDSNKIFKKLKNKYPAYNKNSYNADLFLDNLEDAVTEASKLCSDLLKLEDNYGTNIPNLIRMLQH